MCFGKDKNYTLPPMVFATTNGKMIDALVGFAWRNSEVMMLDAIGDEKSSKPGHNHANEMFCIAWASPERCDANTELFSRIWT